MWKKKLLFFISLFIFFTIFSQDVFSQSNLKNEFPIILSYYWPIDKNLNDKTPKKKFALSMETPNVIDILKNEVHGSLEMRKYWEKNGKIILNRVYVFREFKSESDLYNNYVDNIKNSKGIIIDEILGNKINSSQREIMKNILRRLRSAYPLKIIVVWGSSVWDNNNTSLLDCINKYCDLFIPEIYISEKKAKRTGFHIFNKRIAELNKLSPGILSKTIIGIGLHSLMDDDEKTDFKTHITDQIKFMRTDPFLKNLPGVALYAPYYLPIKLHKTLDVCLKHYVLNNLN